MAKMYYNLDEAMKKLRVNEATLKQAVRDGQLREFRDAGVVNYRIEEIDKLAKSGAISGAIPGLEPDLSASLGPIELADTGNPMPNLSSLSSTGSTGMGTGITLGGTSATDGTTGGSIFGLGLDGSGINLAAGGDDMVSLDEDTRADATAAGKTKEDTVVSSVGVSVFDEEDLDESADPLAKTVMSGTSGGTGLEGVGSGGSGLLDLTRESDDTSLGAELLDEIYPGEEAATVEMGEATRAGLERAIDEPEPSTQKVERSFEPAARETSAGTTVTVRTVTYAPDAFSYGAAGLVAVGLLVTCFTGLTLAAMIRGVWPSLLGFIFGKLWMFGLGTVVIAGAAMGAGIFLGKRSES